MNIVPGARRSKGRKNDEQARPAVDLGDSLSVARRFKLRHPEWTYDGRAWWFDRPDDTSLMLSEDDIAAQVLHDLVVELAPNRPPTPRDVRFVVDCLRWFCLEGRS